MSQPSSEAQPATALAVSIRRLPGAEDVPLPAYQTDHAAGMDLCAAVEQDLVIAPGERALAPCGFQMALPHGYEAQIRPRSGLAVKHGLTVANAPGTIDADYRGQVMVALINLGHEPVTITRGMRVAQMVVQPVPRVAWRCVETLPETDRGEGGFGHTGA